MIDSVRYGESDIGIAAVTINAERNEFVDFSHQYFRAGLQIVTKKEESTLMLFYDTLKSFVSSSVFLYALIILTIVLLVVSHIVWIEERKENDQFSTKYISGISDALYWSFITMTTVGYGDKVTKTRIGKITTIIWVLIGYFLFAYFTASVTTASTVTRLRGSITKLSDLEGKRVAVVKGSTGEIFMLNQNVYPIAVEKIEEAYPLLENGRVEAIVYDAPVLQYSLKNNQNLITVNDIFKEEYYGILFPKGSVYREKINMSLLKIVESDKYKQLYNKWFKEVDLSNGKSY